LIIKLCYRWLSKKFDLIEQQKQQQTSTTIINQSINQSIYVALKFQKLLESEAPWSEVEEFAEVLVDLVALMSVFFYFCRRYCTQYDRLWA